MAGGRIMRRRGGVMRQEHQTGISVRDATAIQRGVGCGNVIGVGKAKITARPTRLVGDPVGPAHLVLFFAGHRIAHVERETAQPRQLQAGQQLAPLGVVGQEGDPVGALVGDARMRMETELGAIGDLVFQLDGAAGGFEAGTRRLGGAYREGTRGLRTLVGW